MLKPITVPDVPSSPDARSLNSAGPVTPSLPSSRSPSSVVPDDICEATVLIVGGGPHALAVLSALHERTLAFSEYMTPSSFEHHVGSASLKRVGSVCIIDPGADFMEGWHKRFELLGIEHLRSPAFAHPAAFEPQALMDFAVLHGREAELIDVPAFTQRLNSGELQQPLMQGLPSTSLFKDFCASLASKLPHRWLSGTAMDIGKSGDGQYRVQYVPSARPTAFCTVVAAAVIFATGPMGKWSVPKPFGSLLSSPQVKHAEELFAAGTMRVAGQRRGSDSRPTVLVIGGGLTAVQVALSAVDEGSRVVLLSRRSLQTRAYDLARDWLDLKHTSRKRFDFLNATMCERIRILRDSRGGGSVPISYMDRLRTLAAGTTSFELQVDPHIDRSTVSLENGKVLVNGSAFDQVILATGTSVEPMLSPLFERAQAVFDAPTFESLPKLDASLRWIDGEDLFVVGGNAMLELGPGALNLMGAMQGAKAVAQELYGLIWKRVEKTELQKQCARVRNLYEFLAVSSDDEAVGIDEYM
mmetsp:Transcript_39904/g.85156  ORF Transcript_39904/g.85156 Transcript_39904/m.85156 type:complete len:527 (-) Transcript_39904:218-1798(-)